MRKQLSIAVSIVVPVYNVQTYLAKCLDSILSQTFSDIEVIVINDGSKDNSQEIINQYAEHHNIITINKDNEGLSETRNKGLLKAQGEYVLFIDSDDYIAPNMVERMYNQAIKTKADIVISKVTYEDEAGIQEPMFTCDFNEEEIIDNKEGIKRFWNGEINGHAWNKLIKRSLMINNNIFFPKGKLYEDAPTLVQLLKEANGISFVNESLYYYLQREGSITKKPSYKSLVDHIEVLSEIERSIASDLYEKTYQKEFQFFLLNSLYFNIYMLNQLYYDDKQAYRKYRKDIQKQINKLSFNNLMNNRYLNMANKLRLVLVKTGLVFQLRHRYK